MKRQQVTTATSLLRIKLAATKKFKQRSSTSDVRKEVHSLWRIRWRSWYKNLHSRYRKNFTFKMVSQIWILRGDTYLLWIICRRTAGWKQSFRYNRFMNAKTAKKIHAKITWLSHQQTSKQWEICQDFARSTPDWIQIQTILRRIYLHNILLLVDLRKSRKVHVNIGNINLH